MRNDLTYIRYYWAKPNQEKLAPGEAEDVIAALVGLYHAALSSSVGRRAKVTVTPAGPPRIACIELGYIVQIDPVGTAQGLAATVSRLAGRAIDISNDNEGFVGFLELLWAVVVGKSLWDLKAQIKKRLRNVSDDERLATKLTQHILRTHAEEMDNVLQKMLQTGVVKVELQLRDEPPAEIEMDAALGRLKRRHLKMTVRSLPAGVGRGPRWTAMNLTCP